MNRDAKGEYVVRASVLSMSVAAAATVMIIFTACTTSKINTSDSTPPKVEVDVRAKNGNYAPMTDIDQSTEPIQILAKVSDPDGVRSADVEFLGSVSDNCTVGNQFYGGGYSLNPPL